MFLSVPMCDQVAVKMTGPGVSPSFNTAERNELPASCQGVEHYVIIGTRQPLKPVIPNHNKTVA